MPSASNRSLRQAQEVDQRGSGCILLWAIGNMGLPKTHSLSSWTYTFWEAHPTEQQVQTCFGQFTQEVRMKTL